MEGNNLRELPARPDTMLELRVRELAEREHLNGDNFPVIEGSTMDELRVVSK